MSKFCQTVETVSRLELSNIAMAGVDVSLNSGLDTQNVSWENRALIPLSMVLRVHQTRLPLNRYFGTVHNL
jgi:hypothetical protein